MRMRDQLIVITAVVVATIAVAANVLAQTRAADRRAEIAQVGLAAAWSYPVVDIPTSTAPAQSDSEPSQRRGDGHSEIEFADPTGASVDSATSCSGKRRCASEEGSNDGTNEEPPRVFMNHGRAVSAYVHSLGFEEGVDGPRGAYVRQTARPDIESEGPPRSDRAEENQDSKDEKTPPGQDSKDERTPPGQENEHEDD
jgi:hypothetical protein